MYATLDDLSSFLSPAPVPSTVSDLTMRNASASVDRMLLGSVYPVDVAGNPTMADHVTALRDAACAQAFYAGTINDPSGAMGNYTSFTIGSISMSRAAGGGSASVGPNPYSQAALDILQVAGLLPGTIASYPGPGADWLERP